MLRNWKKVIKSNTSGYQDDSRDRSSATSNIKKGLKTLDSIRRGRATEQRAIKSSISFNKSKQAQVDREQRASIKSNRNQLNSSLNQGRSQIEELYKNVKTQNNSDHFNSVFSDIKKTNQDLDSISQEQRELSRQTGKRGEQYAKRFDDVLRGAIDSGPNVTEIAAKQQNARNLRDRARLLQSAGRGANQQNVRDYLGQVSSSDVTALQETSAQRAQEVYQRRAQLQKELSAQAIAENYYLTQQTEQLAGAGTTKGSVSQNYGSMLQALNQRQEIDNNLLGQQANAYNTLLNTQTGALNQNLNVSGGILGNIGNRANSTLQQNIGGYGAILSSKQDASNQQAGIGLGWLGSMRESAQARFSRFMDQKRFDENVRQADREFDFKEEERDYRRMQTEKSSAGLKDFVLGLRGASA